MYKRFFAILATVMLFASCSKSKDCAFSDLQITATASEIATIQSYLTANGLTATQHSSGLFYSVGLSGSGTTPGLCSTVTVKYIGQRIVIGTTTATTFETSPTGGIQFQLGQLIAGWQKGIPIVQKGGQIRLYIPPSLAYGAQDVRNPNTGAIVIPANSTLIFDIELLDVQ